MKLWESPLGAFEIEVTEAGISQLQIKDANGVDGPIADELAVSLNEHLHGRPASLRLDLESVTSPIAQLTLAKLLEIPYGELRSYAWVAKEIRHPRAIRAVANAIARNPIPVLIPCHRIIRSDGQVGEYRLGAALKRRLLEFEGVDLAYLEGLALRGTRYIADKENNTYHLLTCRLAPNVDVSGAQEIRNTDDVINGIFDPCRRCRPI